MKNLLLLFTVGVFLVACEKTNIEDETTQIENNDLEVYQVDKDDIIRPGDK